MPQTAQATQNDTGFPRKKDRVAPADEEPMEQNRVRAGDEGSCAQGGAGAPALHHMAPEVRAAHEQAAGGADVADEDRRAGQLRAEHRERAHAER